MPGERRMKAECVCALCVSGGRGRLTALAKSRVLFFEGQAFCMPVVVPPQHSCACAAGAAGAGATAAGLWAWGGGSPACRAAASQADADKAAERLVAAQHQLKQLQDHSRTIDELQDTICELQVCLLLQRHTARAGYLVHSCSSVSCTAGRPMRSCPSAFQLYLFTHAPTPPNRSPFCNMSCCALRTARLDDIHHVCVIPSPKRTA